MSIEYLLPRPDGELVVAAVSNVVGSVQAEVDRRVIHRGRGRPAIDIPEDQLVMLLEHHFTVTDIAHMLHVSPRTIRRRVLSMGLRVPQCTLICQMINLTR